MVLREARRFLRGSPLLTLSAVSVLGLGMGASSSALTLLVAFSSVNYPGMRDSGYATVAEGTSGGGSAPISWERFEEQRASPPRGASLAAYSREIRTTLYLNGQPEPLKAAAVSRGFFSVFTRPLTAGRDFSSADEELSARHVVVLGLPLAVRLFHSPEAALNRVVRMGQSPVVPYAVVGVAPAGFRGVFGSPVDAWVPASSVVPLLLALPAGLATPAAWKVAPSFYSLAASSRLTSAALAAELNGWPPLRTTRGAALHASQGLTTDPARDARARRWLRLGLLLVLIFTVASGLNYSLLLLARTPRRTEEVRLRKLLGAGNGRLAAELMVGPAVAVVLGLAAASVFSAGGLVLVSRLSDFYGELVRGSWLAALTAFAVQVPLACALTLVVALVPVGALVRGEAAPLTQYASTPGRRAGSILQAVVVLQIALCVGTWILTGMIVSAVASAVSAPLGYDPNHLAVLYVGPSSGPVSFTVGPGASFPPASAVEGLLGAVKSIPGVRSACFAASAPFGSPPGVVVIQRVDIASAASRTVGETAVSPGYFGTIGARLLRGNEFSWKDLPGSANRVIVNEALARELWPDSDPIGRPIRLSFRAFAGIPTFTRIAIVAGVAEDSRFSGPAESPEPTVFKSLSGTAFVTSYVVVDGMESIDELRDVVSRELDTRIPGLGVLDAFNVAGRLEASRWREEERAYFALAGALLMALVAGIGLYGSLVYYVNAKRRELAVRISLGASPWDLRKIILARAVRCGLLAAALAVPLWPAAAQLSSNQYLGRVSWSAGRAALLSAACVLGAILVSLLPAGAAARVAPAKVLKDQ